MKKIKLAAFAGLAILVIIAACQRDAKDMTPNTSPSESKVSVSKPTKTKMDVPVITCFSSSQGSIDLQVCAGATGAPAGFSLHWMTEAAYAANGSKWPSDETGLCKASFSGNANDSRYNLGAGQCIVIRIGDILFDNGTSSTCTDELVCGTKYVFRAFAHANSSLMRSDFTANTSCTTSPCQSPLGCTYSQGHWRTHGPEGCNPSNGGNSWPVTSMTLGNTLYTDAQLCSIFNTPAGGNGLIILAHQLAAAKMNIANGADGSSINASISAADAMIGNLVIPPVGAGNLSPASVDALKTALENYNLGVTGPGHCQE
jgi:hypothetical protein